MEDYEVYLYKKLSIRCKNRVVSGISMPIGKIDVECLALLVFAKKKINTDEVKLIRTSIIDIRR